MKKKQAHVIISGFVQGVCFRYETRRQAQLLNLAGWVMNRRDGNVEAVFEGAEEDVDSIVEWCRRGASGSVVDKVDVKESKYIGEFESFDIKF